MACRKPPPRRTPRDGAAVAKPDIIMVDVTPLAGSGSSNFAASSLRHGRPTQPSACLVRAKDDCRPVGGAHRRRTFRAFDARKRRSAARGCCGARLPGLNCLMPIRASLSVARTRCRDACRPGRSLAVPDLASLLFFLSGFDRLTRLAAHFSGVLSIRSSTAASLRGLLPARAPRSTPLASSASLRAAPRRCAVALRGSV